MSAIIIASILAITVPKAVFGVAWCVFHVAPKGRAFWAAEYSNPTDRRTANDVATDWMADYARDLNWRNRLETAETAEFAAVS